MALGKWDMYFVLCNLLVGSGFIAIPSAFRQGGVLVSSIGLLIIALINWLLHREILEITEEFSLSADEPLLHADRQLRSPHQWDLPAIIHKIMGYICYAVYFPSFVVYLVMLMSTYSSLFGRTLCVIFDCEDTSDCKMIYYLGLAAFMLLTEALTVLDYAQQIWVHRIMVVLQFLLATLIGVFVIQFFQVGNEVPWQYTPEDLPNFLSSIQAIIFACWYFVAAPSVLAASAKHHKSQKKVVFWMFMSSMVIFGVIGCLAGILLDNKASNSVSFYQDFTKKGQSSLLFPILVIPAIDYISNSAIVGQTLSGAIFSAFYGTNHKAERKNHPHIYNILRLSSPVYPFIISTLSPTFVSAR